MIIMIMTIGITIMMARAPTLNPVAGLDPAIHVLFRSGIVQPEDVDARDKPRQGDFPEWDRPEADR